MGFGSGRVLVSLWLFGVLSFAGGGVQDPRPIDATSELTWPLERDQVTELVWAAGRPELAGLSKARLKERREAQSLEVERLEAFLDESPTATDGFRSILRRVLEDPSTPEPLVAAGLRVVGELGLVSLADLLVDRIEGTDAPALAARGSLHRLYGVWFTERSEAEPFLANVEPGRVKEAYVAEVEKLLARERASLLALAGVEPLAIDYTHPDPDLRRALADRVVQSWTEVRTDDPVDLAMSLGATAIQAAERERDGLALGALLELCLAMFQSGGATTERWDELVALLDTVADRPADERTLVLARAFARLPWAGLDAAAERSTSERAEGGVRRIARLLDRAFARTRFPSEPDRDLVVGILAELGGLSDRMTNAGLADVLAASPARESLFRLLEDGEAEIASRAAAVGTLRPLVAATDGERLASVLEDARGEPQLVRAVLGSIGQVLLLHGEQAVAKAELLNEIAVWSTDEDPDLRRYALAILANERLGELQKLIPVRVLVERIGDEHFDDIVAAKLNLVASVGTPGELDALLELESFDALVRDKPAVLEALFNALGTLSNGSTFSRFKVARRLLQVEHQDTRLARVRRAAAIAGAEQADAVELGPLEHQDLVAWAWELYAAGVELEDVTTGFAERLQATHLPAIDGLELPAETRARTEHLRAVFASRAEVPDDAVVTGHFARALEQSAKAANSQVRGLARRDRARYLAGRGAVDEALADLRALFESGVLSNADHRLAVDLLESDTSARQANAPEAFEWLWRLVQRKSWTSETTGARWGDLERLFIWAEASSTKRQLFTRLEGLYTGLPEAGAELEASVLEIALWAGLEREEGGLERLRAQAEKATLGARTPDESETGENP